MNFLKKNGKSSTTKRTESKKESKEDEWVFDSLVGFLTGPIWNIPLLDFMENNCYEFDVESFDGNPEKYEKYHKEYKHLVDLMLNSFMQDLGISVEQFEKACVNARSEEHNGLSHIRETLLEQICAAEDYDIFLHMMTQKNSELQLQTLQYLQRKGQTEDGSNLELISHHFNDNDHELQEVIKRSIEEHEALIAQLDSEKEELNKILASTLEEEKSRLEKENKIEIEMLKKAMKLSLDEHQYNESKSDSLEVKGGDGSASSSPVQSPENIVDNVPKEPTLCQKSAQPTATSNGASKEDIHLSKEENVSEMEIANRRAYLRQQRDKIVAMKRNVRKMRIDHLSKDDSSSAKQRPKSAKTAKDTFENNNSETSALDPDILAARQALARRLKTEVVAHYHHPTSSN